jgi:hypothetical protein
MSTVALPPITVEQIREIIAGLGSYNMPSDDALNRLAVVFTARQSQYDPVWPGFPARAVDALGNEYIIKAPLLIGDDIPDDLEDRKRPDGSWLGHPRYTGRKLWHHLVKDMYDEFCGAMAPVNPDCKFDPGSAAARFLEQVIPLVTGETPAAATIGQQLKQGARPR